MLAHSQRFIGTVVAVLLSLISVVTLATVSGIDLHNLLQTKHYVEAWHKDSHELWSQQAGIDARFQNEVDALADSILVVRKGDDVRK